MEECTKVFQKHSLGIAGEKPEFPMIENEATQSAELNSNHVYKAKVSQSATLIGNRVNLTGTLDVVNSSVLSENLQVKNNAKCATFALQSASLVGRNSKVGNVEVINTQVASRGLHVTSPNVAESFDVSKKSPVGPDEISSMPQCASQSCGSMRHSNVQSNMLACVVAPNSQVHGSLSVTGSKIQTTIIQQPMKPIRDLPESWNMPPRNKNFIGRSDLVTEVSKRLQETTQPLVLTALNGLGGVGKTNVALQFAWENYQKYNGVAWFNAETKTHLESDYIGLGSELNIFHGYEKATNTEKANHVKHWLEDPSRACWLLVYDNATSYGGENGIGSLIPTKKGAVLITSRMTQGWPEYTLDVNVFKPEESQEYIEKILSSAVDIQEVSIRQQLATILGNLPLALAQCCAFIKKSHMPIERYLILYQQKKQSLLSDKTLAKATLHASETQMCVYTTWDITMDAIREESTLATNWLAVCAYLDSSDIQDFLLETFAEDPIVNPDEEFFELARGTLYAYSLVRYDKNSCSCTMHNLLQEVIKLKHKTQKTEEEIVIRTALLLQKCYTAGNKSMSYSKEKALLPHFSILLPYLELLSEDKVYDQTLIDHLYNQANSLYYIGEFQKYVEILEKRVHSLISKYGLQNVEVAKTYVNLGEGYRLLGQHSKQKALLEQAVSILEQFESREHDNKLAVALCLLGTACSSFGQHEEQIKYLERALFIFRELDGADSGMVAAVLMKLSMAFGVLRNYEQRDILLKETLRIEKLHPSENEQLTSALVRSGINNSRHGNHQQQIELIKEALETEKQHYGSKHIVVARTLYELASASGSCNHCNIEVTTDISRNQKLLLEEALEIQEEHYGKNHIEIAITLVVLADVYGNLGEYQERKVKYLRAIPLFKKNYGDNHFYVGVALERLGDTYKYLGKYEEELKVLQESLSIFQKSYGLDDLRVAKLSARIASLYRNLGYYDKQKELLTAVVANFEGSEHPDVVQIRADLILLNSCKQ